MRISDWSSDVCSSDLGELRRFQRGPGKAAARQDGIVEVRTIELEIGKIPPAALPALAAGPTGQVSIVARQGPDDGLWRQARGHGELRAEGGRYVTDSTATLDKPTQVRHAFVTPNAASLPSLNCHGNPMTERKSVA